MKWLLYLLMGFILVSVSYAATLVTECANLNVASETYNVISDIYNTTNTITSCFNITANDITLDCNWHKIQSNASNSSIYVEADGVTIRNCNISMLVKETLIFGVFRSNLTSDGIMAYRSNNLQIRNIFINPIRDAFGGRKNINISQSSDVIIDNMTIFSEDLGQASTDAIFDNSTSIQVYNSTFNCMDDFGFTNSSNIVWINNSHRCFITGEATNKISFTDASEIRYHNNQFRTDVSTSQGITTSGVHGINITNNLFLQPTLASGSFAITYQDSRDGIITNNNITTHGKMIVIYRSNNTIFENSTIKNCTVDRNCLTVEGCVDLWGSSNIQFKNIHVLQTNEQQAFFGRTSLRDMQNVTVEDSSFESDPLCDVVSLLGSSGESNIVHMINVTYNRSKESVDGDGLEKIFRQWKFSAYVNDTDGSPVSGAIVKISNFTYSVLNTTTTGADGQSPEAVITDYISLDDAVANFYHLNQSPLILNITNGSHFFVDTNFQVVNNSINGSYTITTVVPSVLLNSPIDGADFNNNVVSLNWTVNQSVGSITNCSVTINGSIEADNFLNVTGTQQTYQYTGFRFGNYSWNVTCKNSFNQTNTSATRYFSYNWTEITDCGTYGPGKFVLINDIENDTVDDCIRLNSNTRLDCDNHLIQINNSISGDLIQFNAGTDIIAMNCTLAGNTTAFGTKAGVKITAGSFNSSIRNFNISNLYGAIVSETAINTNYSFFKVHARNIGGSGYLFLVDFRDTLLREGSCVKCGRGIVLLRTAQSQFEKYSYINFSNGEGLALNIVDSDDNRYTNLNFDSAGQIAIKAVNNTAAGDGSQRNILTDGIIKNSNIGIRIEGLSSVEFVNMSYISYQMRFPGSSLKIKWYFRPQVNDTQGTVIPDARVFVFNQTKDIYVAETRTNNEGIAFFNLTELDVRNKTLVVTDKYKANATNMFYNFSTQVPFNLTTNVLNKTIVLSGDRYYLTLRIKSIRVNMTNLTFVHTSPRFFPTGNYNLTFLYDIRRFRR